MKRYAVFTNTEFVTEYELSVSRKIILKEDVVTILGIVREWVKSVLGSDFSVYLPGGVKLIENFAIHLPLNSNRDIRLLVVLMPSNVRFRLGEYKTTYTTREV